MTGVGRARAIVVLAQMLGLTYRRRRPPVAEWYRTTMMVRDEQW